MVNKNRHQEIFNQIYKGLNTQQRIAVDIIEGTVMVLAGPGTGKTQILSARIGKILLETDALPNNILCLTYTEAGVVAMRKRLLSFIGSDAYKVHIHTFHSFCNMVIQENTHLLNANQLEALSDLERIQFLKELIDGFEKDNPLKRYKGEVYYDVPNFIQLFSAIKREGWKTVWLIEKIDEYTQAIIPETDGLYNKREKAKGNIILTQKGKDEVERMQKLKAAIHSFEYYQQILKKNDRYDFDDMINWVIQLFETNNDVLLRYQEQFQYILVDEYQDTSGSQNKIIELLISFWQNENPNLFVVGDDDQSIYRFQGANLQNMMHLANRFKDDMLRVVLTQNYRSVPNILKVAQTLIENNEQRLANQHIDLTKKLTAANVSLQSLNISPVIRVYENEFAENVHITQSIKTLIQKDVSPSHIAIIYREHKTGDELLKFLQQEKIPYYVKRSINLLDDLFIQHILQIIRYIVAELDTPASGDVLLFEILHYDFFNITAAQIANICNIVAESKVKKNNISTIRMYMQQLAQNVASKLSKGNDLFSQQNDMSSRAESRDGTEEAIINLHNTLEKLQKEVYNKSLQHWFEAMINELGILSYIMQQEEKALLMSKLSCLFNYIQEETHRHPHTTLKNLIQHFEVMQDNNLRLDLIQTTGNDTGVNLLTCHGSKGLEYEYVFLINARNDVWEGKRKYNKGFRLPPNIFEQDNEATVEEELRRLFFVAITRAEKYLYISYPQMKNDGALLEPSQFIEEIKQPLHLPVEHIQLSEAENIHFSALRFSTAQKPILAEVEKNYVDTMLNSFVMNLTALNNYLDCPLKFYYTNIVKVPGAKSEAMQFGTAVHGALSDFINYMMKHDKKYPAKDFLIDKFVHRLYRGRETFTQQSLQRFTEHGKNVLSAYHDKYYNPSPTGEFIVTEYPLTKITLQHIPLKGFIDKIQFYGNDIIVTDFKTGSSTKAKERGEFDKPGTDKKPNGGNYWRQAVFYNILINHLPDKNWNILYTQFDFIEINAKAEFDIEKITVTPTDIEYVTQQIIDTWKNIQQHNFYTGCGKSTCEWCNFVKEHKLYTSLLEEEPEMA